MKPWSPRWALLVLLVLTACARSGVAVMLPPRPAFARGYEQTGSAFWDARPSQERRPGRGEVYDTSQMTASHAALPLGSRVVVENLLNRRVIEVWITGRDLPPDRGILSLSPAAARALGALEAGGIPARLRVLALPGPRPSAASRGFAIQVASFTSEYRATVLKDVLERGWTGAQVQRVEAEGQTFYRVRIGASLGRREARRLALRLAAAGYPVIVLEE